MPPKIFCTFCSFATTAFLLASQTPNACFANDKTCLISYVQEDANLYSDVPKSLQSAKWIWPSPEVWYDIKNAFAMFRKSFELPSKPKCAKIHITADQCYRLYVNGKFVCSGPERGFQKNWKFDTVDISKYLNGGKNAIAVRAYNGGRSTFSYISESYAGLIFAIEADGLAKPLVSDSSVKGMRQNSCASDTIQYSNQLNDQEHIDMRKDPAGWKDTDFDDSAWGGCSAHNFGTMPWYNLSPRVSPMLLERELPPPRLVSKGRGKSSSPSENVRDAVAVIDADGIISERMPSENAGALPLVAEASPGGEVSSFTVDFGRVVAGRPILEIKGAKGGEIVDIRMGELLREYDNDTFASTSSHMRLGNRLICRPGAQIHDFFHPAGARYMTIRVRNNPESRLEITPKMISYMSDLKEKGSFKTSNPLANKIWDASRHTQRICALDAYVDTPYREQAQWWGDARVQSWNTFFIANDTRLLKKGISDIAAQRVPNGLTYGHAPTMAHNCILPDFSIIWMLTLWDYYWQTGDVSIFAENQKTVDDLIKYFESHKDPQNGLISYDPRYWLFLDWTKIHKEGQPALLSLWYLNALEKMEKLAAAAGKPDGAKRYSALAAKMREAIEKTLVDPSDGLVRDGVFANGEVNPNKGVHAQTLAAMSVVGGFDSKRAINDILLPFVKRDKPKDGDPSSYWVVYVLQTLIDAGYQREVYDYILKKWSEMAEFGSTFEDFEINRSGKSDAGGSASHAWSAHPAFLLPQILGGIKQLAPGWAKYESKPNKFEKSARIVWPTPKGDILVEW